MKAYLHINLGFLELHLGKEDYEETDINHVSEQPGYPYNHDVFKRELAWWGEQIQNGNFTAKSMSWQYDEWREQWGLD